MCVRGGCGAGTRTGRRCSTRGLRSQASDAFPTMYEYKECVHTPSAVFSGWRPASCRRACAARHCAAPVSYTHLRAHETEADL
eukprot:166286-Rhodomonas_salina.2